MSNRIIVTGIGVCMMMAMASCGNRSLSSADAVSKDSIEDTIQTQAELNEESGNWSIAYNDSIEREYQALLSALPQYKEILSKEKETWQTYMEAIREVARFGDHGSSSPMYVDGIVNLGIRLREQSIRNLCLHTKGATVSYSKTKFTATMIANAYSAFIKAANLYEEFDQDELGKYQDALRKEQKCWDDWMNCRASVSSKLTRKIRKVYNEDTNLLMRTKLLQLKNQNRDLGMIGGEVMNCALPWDCSDKVLLDYPGFDKVWDKHCQDTDWYPQF